MAYTKKKQVDILGKRIGKMKLRVPGQILVYGGYRLT